MAQGLIAAALGGFGKGLATIGEMESKKQNEASLRKELMAAESEERLRIDEITRRRDIEGIGAKTEATARANLAAAPIVGQTSVAEESAKLEAANTTGLSAKRAEFKAGEAIADIDARSKLKVAEKEANEAADKRVAELTAEKTKGVTKLEAERTARVEKEKYQAMIDAGVPKVKADALLAEYTAGDAQRKKQAEDAITAEIDAAVKKGSNKKFLAAESNLSVAKSAGSIAEINAREAARDKRDKTDRARNTVEMERQIKETEKEMGRILGIGDPKKIADELSYLESQAKKGDKDAIDKLARVKPLADELNSLSKDLRSYKRGGSDTSSSSGETATYKKGEERTIASGPNKGKTVTWDGNGWVLK
jgi:hypothetical protein